MKAFRFSLHAILTLREEREQEAQRALAEALRVVATLRADLAAVAQLLSKLGSDLKARLEQGISAHEMGELGNYARLLSDRRLVLLHDLTIAEPAVQRAQAALLRATQERQALENHREKLHQAHRYAQARLEQKVLDELAGRAAPPGAGRSICHSNPKP